MKRLYFDYNATTPVESEVVQAMVAVLQEGCGNPSSLHAFGQRARALVDDARGEVAALAGASAAEVVFTGSGTESDNMALWGVAAASREPRRTIVFSSIEHHAVVHTARALADEGFPVKSVRATPDGRIDLEDLRSKVDKSTALVAVMLANNETGVLQPLEEVCAIARAHDAPVLCDAVQGAGKLPLDFQGWGLDLMALSGHKFGGPQGVGALCIKRGTRLRALVRGGSQERNRRAGTENVPGIVGMGCAALLARDGLAGMHEVGRLRDRLEERLLDLPDVRLNGGAPRVANTTNLSFDGVDAESLLMALDLAGLAVSTGAACAAGAIQPSHVLRAMGMPMTRVQSSLRFSLGRRTTEEEIERATELVAAAVERQRSLAHPGTTRTR